MVECSFYTNPPTRKTKLNFFESWSFIWCHQCYQLLKYPVLRNLRLISKTDMEQKHSVYDIRNLFNHGFEEQFNIEIQTIFNSQMCVLFSRNNKRSGTSLYRLVFREKFNAKQFSKPKWDSTSATSILFIIFLITP